MVPPKYKVGDLILCCQSKAIGKIVRVDDYNDHYIMDWIKDPISQNGWMFSSCQTIQSMDAGDNLLLSSKTAQLLFKGSE